MRKTFGERALNWATNNRTTAIIGLLAFGLAVFMTVREFQQSKRSATSGVLVPDSDTSQKYFAINGQRLLIEDPNGVLFTDHGQPLVTVHDDGGKLLVSTQIRNEQGDVIAELKDNEWEHQSKPAIFDRNYTDNVLEVRDASGAVALQVADIGDSISVEAVFHCKSGWTYGLVPMGDAGFGIELRPPHVPLQHSISPICEYPSDLHFGSCPGIAHIKDAFDKTKYWPAGEMRHPVNLCI